MSTSTYYSFISTTSDKIPQTSIDVHRQTTVSPTSFDTSSSNSNSSLYQLNSLAPASIASTSPVTSSTYSSSSSSSSSASSSASSPSCVNSIRSNSITCANHHFLLDHQQRELHRQSSITPTQSHQHASQMFHSYTLHSLEPKPLKPFKTSSDYLEAMKEDLAEWLNRLYSDLDLNVDNFFNQLETGSIICRHANKVTQMGRSYQIDKISSNNSKTISQNDSMNSIETSSNQSFSPSTSNNDCSLQSADSQNTTSLSLFSPMSSLKSDRNINWYQVKTIAYKQDANPGTFFARDNICQFILWCRSLNILECLLFETDDLVARKNEKSFILCLLEVARIGFKVGMPTPLIIQLEQEIDREIENDAKLQKQLEEVKKHNQDDDTIVSLDDNDDVCGVSGNPEQLVDLKNQINSDSQLQNEKGSSEYTENEYRTEGEEIVEEKEEQDFGPKPQVITNDLLSLHEKVVQLLCQCTCPTQFPMVRVGNNGKYKVGDKLIIFVRILRRHIMVRVGGGWQELSEFLRVKDPCRSRALQHLPHQNSPQQNSSQNLTKSSSPSSMILRSRLMESNQHLSSRIPNLQNNSSHRIHHHNQNYRNTGAGGHRLISGSASMSWLSNNS